MYANIYIYIYIHLYNICLYIYHTLWMLSRGTTIYSAQRNSHTSSDCFASVSAAIDACAVTRFGCENTSTAKKNTTPSIYIYIYGYRFLYKVQKRLRSKSLDDLPEYHDLKAPLVINWGRSSMCFVLVVDCRPVQSICCGHAPLQDEGVKPAYERITNNIVSMMEAGWDPQC